jgi:hypothetical protein
MKTFVILIGLTTLFACSRGASHGATLAGIEDVVDGASQVAIGMTDSEVSGALHVEPIERKGIEVAWRLEKGEHPGVAVGRFIDGYLNSIQFTARLDSPSPPRIDKQTAGALTKYDVVTRAIAGNLTLAEVEASIGKHGRRAIWTLAQGQNRTTRSISTWVWEINPGGKVLIVPEEDGKASQPYIRELRH